MTYETLLLDVSEGIGTVTVNRPKALNALNGQVLRELFHLFGEIGTNDQVKGIIVTGAGDRAFIAGADIAEMKGRSVTEAAAFGSLGHSVMNAIDRCPKVVVAAVNGFALGGGLELALSCDFIYASDNAKLGLPEVGLGIFPGWGGTQRLPRRIGIGRAKELIFTGRILSAQEALEWGIVNRVVPSADLIPAARATLKEILGKGLVAVDAAKRLINRGIGESLLVGLELEKTAFAQCFATEDATEGMTAFLEKRKPNFTGS